MKNMKKIVFITIIATLFFVTRLHAEEGDFFFAPEVGWSHFFNDNLKEGVYTGAHFSYDTSDHLSLEIVGFYGDNNGEGTSPDLRYILGGGGLAYNYRMGRFKPSAFAGATVAGIDFSDRSARFKGGFYFGSALEYYLNKVVSLGLTFKYFPILKTSDICMLGFRFGLEL